MKKGRIGLQFTVIAKPEHENALSMVLFQETSTLGVRVRDERRYEAHREVMHFDSSLGSASVKLRRIPNTVTQVAPEFEACRLLAEMHDLPIADVYALVQREASEQLFE
jgi:uncharacterized protein (DUF111 family)